MMIMVRKPVVSTIDSQVTAGIVRAFQQFDFARSAQVADAFAAIDTTAVAGAVAGAMTALRELDADEVLRIQHAWAAAADEELETYEFVHFLEPANRWQLQTTVAVLVFVGAALCVAENYEVANAVSTITGFSPHMLAATAWWLIGRVLQHLHDRLE